MEATWKRKEAAEITGIPDRRILFYTEQNMLPGMFAAVGRGASRVYTLKHLFFLAVIKELDALGFSLARIRPVIISLFAKTISFTDSTAPTVLTKPKIWVNGTFTKEPVIMVISIPQGPEEHALSPESEGYNNELFILFPDGSTKVKVLAERPSSIILNLNKIFNSLGLE